MHIRIFNLDDAVVRQAGLVRRYQPDVQNLRRWGPRIRLGCGFAAFRRFEQLVGTILDCEPERGPALTFLGSGDFHHVTLALLRRQREPFNLLVLNNHPAWMRGLPFLHCGSWLGHAARLPLCRRIFHVGGTRDFDNSYQWMAPWSLLRSGKITVFPAVTRFVRGRWGKITHQALRLNATRPVGAARVAQLLRPYRQELGSAPLYVSLDKDVMEATDAAVNWDSGRLTLAEVKVLLQNFRLAAHDKLAGIDLVGDASPTRVEGLARRALQWLERGNRPDLRADATRRNQRTNLALMPMLGVAPPVIPFVSAGLAMDPEPLSA